MKTTTPYAGPNAGTVRRISWGGIIAGTAVAAALMVFFTTLGIGIGAATLDPAGASPSASAFGIGGGIYTIVTQIVAVAVGGFVAARFAGIPRTLTAMLHGATVWAVTTLLLAWVAISSGGALLGAASGLVGNAASGASNLAQAIAPDDISLPDPADVASRISMDQLPEEVRQTLEERDITPEDLQRDARQAFRQVVSEEEQQAIVADARETLQSILSSPGSANEELQGFLDETLTGPDAVLNDDDRQQTLEILQQRTGISPEEAEQIVQRVETNVEEQITALREQIAQARDQAVEAAQQAAEATSAAAFGLALSSILCLLAAAGGAVLGRPSTIVGDRRDDHI